MATTQLAKPSIADQKDDAGNELVIGALYSVYQTNDTPGGGMLLWYVGLGEWLDSDTDEPKDIPSEEFCHGIYEYACHQAVQPRRDLIANA